MSAADVRTHEVTFCSRISKWADAIFSQEPAWPFKRTEIEESKGIKRKRSDLRVYDSAGVPILAGEVKLPGTVEGRNPHNSNLVEDAYLKASNIGAQYFFTWNVNRFVLFDLKQWNVPIAERRVKEYDLDLDLDEPSEVSRPEVEERVRRFLRELFTELNDITEGRKPDWSMPPDEYFIRAFESHIAWPVRLTSHFLWSECERSKVFDERIQQWMAIDQGWSVVRNDPKIWRTLTIHASLARTSSKSLQASLSVTFLLGRAVEGPSCRSV